LWLRKVLKQVFHGPRSTLYRDVRTNDDANDKNIHTLAGKV
jgi:hypothetical protein